MTTMRGIYPILAMPFLPDGAIDETSLRREVDFLIEAGVDGLGIALASEVPLLTEGERDQALRVVVAAARGRVPIVMNTGAAGTDLAIHYARRARELGASALMVLPPPYAGPGSEVIEYFHAIARAVPLPIFIQDVPTAPVAPATAAAIARGLDHQWYVKAENPPTPPRVVEAVRQAEGRLTVFGGAHGLFFLEELRRGAVGTMPGSALPEAFVPTWKLWQAGKTAEAAAHFTRYGTILRHFTQQTGIATYLIKEILHRRGVFDHVVVRRPAVRPDALAQEEMNALLAELGL
jgi:4-hydroxy-tetrahydrodipicolinate synthase